METTTVMVTLTMMMIMIVTIVIINIITDLHTNIDLARLQKPVWDITEKLSKLSDKILPNHGQAN